MSQSTVWAAAAALSIAATFSGPADAGAIRNSTATMHAAPRASVTTSAQPTTLGPTHTGQPNQTCGSTTAPNTPGNAATAPGSAFNPNGVSGSVYAGEQPQNSRNTVSVSQYDVACFHQR